MAQTKTVRISARYLIQNDAPAALPSYDAATSALFDLWEIVKRGASDHPQLLRKAMAKAEDAINLMRAPLA